MGVIARSEATKQSGVSDEKKEIASLPSPEVHEGRRSLAMTNYNFSHNLFKIKIPRLTSVFL
jgi:hypothetical protein